jgi:hypothetical protein
MILARDEREDGQMMRSGDGAKLFDRTTADRRTGRERSYAARLIHPSIHPSTHPSSGHGPFGAQDSGRLAPGRVRWIDRPIDRSTGENPASRRRQACSSSGEVEEWNSRPGEPSCRRRYRLGVGRTATTPTIVRTAADKRDETKVFSVLLRRQRYKIHTSAAAQTHIIISCFH